MSLLVRLLTILIFDILCATQNSSQVGAINKNDLLGPEALDQPGKKEGQVLVIKNAAGGAEAYQVRSVIFASLRGL